MVDVGLAYENGQGGLARDRARAIKLYRQAAAFHDEEAIEALKRLRAQ